MSDKVDISHLLAFLPCRTPEAWVARALQEPEILLVDHAHCEKKAAATALNLMFRYVDRTELLQKMAQLAREELLHFEQVLELLQKRGYAYGHLSSSRYAAGLRQHARTSEPGKLIDILIIGALIEARSCERFHALSGRVDAELGRYYRYLLKSESRHFEDYLALAREFAGDNIDARIAFFCVHEKALIEDCDPEFRFHSGVPEPSPVTAHAPTLAHADIPA